MGVVTAQVGSVATRLLSDCHFFGMLDWMPYTEIFEINSRTWHSTVPDGRKVGPSVGLKQIDHPEISDPQHSKGE
jgi:hypothetical protein